MTSGHLQDMAPRSRRTPTACITISVSRVIATGYLILMCILLTLLHMLKGRYLESMRRCDFPSPLYHLPTGLGIVNSENLGWLYKKSSIAEDKQVSLYIILIQSNVVSARHLSGNPVLSPTPSV